MTATNLLDLLARNIQSRPQARDSAGLLTLAEKMVAVCLSDLEHLRGYERDLGLDEVSDPKLELELRQTIRSLYQQWADSADELYHCVQSLCQGGVTVNGVERLNDKIGSIQARLTLKPEQVVRARQQVRDGQIIPAKELRDELNAKLRG